MVWVWIGFVLFVLMMLALDLGVFHRKAHVVSVKEALMWSAIWIALGLSFSVFIYFGYENHWEGLGTKPDVVDRSAEHPQGLPNDGKSAVVKYITGYVVEKSLSVDNIFVIAMIFTYFAVPAIYQHRVLFWGILGALVMRGAMIGIGAQLIARFTWILYLFGGFLIFTGIKMFMVKGHGDPGENVMVRLARRFFNVTEHYHGQHFFVRAGSKASHEAEIPAKIAQRAGLEADTPATHEQPDKVVEQAKAGAMMLTPLALALILVETTDLIFAVDSIPAIFAITGDPFLVFTSNVFAILGLRSLYFALAGLMDKFAYLKHALAIVLVVVGVKMLAHSQIKAVLGEHFNFYLLGVVMLILAGGVVASLIHQKKNDVTEMKSAHAT